MNNQRTVAAIGLRGVQRAEGEIYELRLYIAGQTRKSVTALANLRRLCEEHPGTVPVFVHLLLPTSEVVVRARDVSVDATRDLVAKLDGLLGAGATMIDHAGRA